MARAFALLSGTAAMIPPEFRHITLVAPTAATAVYRAPKYATRLRAQRQQPRVIRRRLTRTKYRK